MVDWSHIGEALEILENHSQVIGPVQRDGQLSDGSVAFQFEMAVQRPPLGYHNGVKAREPVRLWLPQGYPFRGPRISLRENFCQALPHINPSPFANAGRVEPCVIDEQPATFVRWNGLSAYLDRLQLWLDDVAHDNLRERDRGWEPMRRNGWDFRLLAPVNALRGLVRESPGYSILAARHVRRQTTWGLSAIKDTRTFSPGKIAGIAEDDIAVAPVLVAWPGRDSISDFLEPDRHMSLGELRCIARRFGDTELGSGLQRLVEAVQGSTSPFPALIVVLAVRRPLALQGTDPPSEIELLPYLVEARLMPLPVGRAMVFDGDAGVRPMPMHDLPSRNLACKLSGLSFPSKGGLAILGCGSLGSKVAIHIGKAGLGDISLHDYDVLLPHNLLRMGVVFNPVLSGFNKVEAVASDLRCLGLDPDPSGEDIVGRLAAEASLGLPEDTVLALDTTASPNVHDALCRYEKAVAPGRLAQAAFLAQGRLAFFRVEGDARAPDVEDLETAMWRRWMDNQPMDALDLSEGRGGLHPIDVGQGCTSTTMVMSDMAASLLAAGIAQQTAVLMSHGPAVDGLLSTAVVGEDGCSVHWTHGRQAPSIRSACNDGWTIRILPQVDAEIAAQISKAGENETGGYLLARINWVLRRITVAAHLPAPPDSICRPNQCILGVQGAREALTDLAARSFGALRPAGTWHSHPRGGGTSRTDIDTLHTIAQDLIGQPALGLIWRPEGYLAMVRQDRGKRNGDRLGLVRGRNAGSGIPLGSAEAAGD